VVFSASAIYQHHNHLFYKAIFSLEHIYNKRETPVLIGCSRGTERPRAPNSMCIKSESRCFH
jgi:hypothetical protein